jgi:hypothetical protein
LRLGLILLDCRRICEKIAQIDFSSDDEDRYPYPYIFKPPEPPDDLGVTTQLQVEEPIEEELEVDLNCKYCGSKLKKEQKYCKLCGKKVEKKFM